MFAARTELKNAQKVKQYLMQKKVLDTNYLLVKEFGLIYFPMVKKIKVPSSFVVNVKFNFPHKDSTPTIDSLLESKLSEKELQLLPRSQEIVGKIMILEVPEQLRSTEKLIAEAYLAVNKSIDTVVRKEQMHTGEFRLRKLKILAGDKCKETIHQENGVKIKLHLEKTYFSARLANERLRIAKTVKSGEEVLVMFSGAAPYPLVIAKNSSAKIVYGVELNPWAHRYAVENVALNGLVGLIIVMLGDVRKVVPRLNKKFDRVVMPLPKTGELFLDVALNAVRKGGIIHYYSFLHESEIVPEATKIKELCQKYKRSVRILKNVKCGQFSPGVFRICFDLKINR